jgi:hypothetical protein
MKNPIIFIGILTVALTVNLAFAKEQEQTRNYFEKEQFVVAALKSFEPKTAENSSEVNSYFDPTTILPTATKTLMQEIRENNLIIDSDLDVDTVVSHAEKSIYQIIKEDIQITEADNLDACQPLYIDTYNNNCYASSKN